jgi:SWIM zinc finger
MVSLRETKGREIAARATLERDGVYWRVPSQAGEGVYVVDMASTLPTCTCQDYELRGLKCKHLYTVQPVCILPVCWHIRHCS